MAIGGGHGLSASLRAIRTYAREVTAVVSVADDGGSSGLLRAAIPDLPAPGDVRKCLGALAADEQEYARILEHRFEAGEFEGHALGNLLLVALSLELGSFGYAVDELARRVGAVGRVLPATVEPVALVGLRAGDDGARAGSESVVGQVAVQNTAGLRQVRLQPETPSSSPEVARAILDADQVVIGPGSLFTSVLAAAVVPAVRDALQCTDAQRVWVANVAAQDPETLGLSVLDERRLIADHGIGLDVVVVDAARARCLPLPVAPRRDDAMWVSPALADQRGTAHDPARLAAALAELAHRRT